jgi:uncharacterized membrane protein
MRIRTLLIAVVTVDVLLAGALAYAVKAKTIKPPSARSSPLHHAESFAVPWGWTGKTGKGPHKHWTKCMFETGKVPVRNGKAPVRNRVHARVGDRTSEFCEEPMFLLRCDSCDPPFATPP